MTQYTKHVFVCTYGPYCWHDGDVDAIFDGLKQAVAKAGLKDEIRINRSGCLNQCGHGPMVVVYPEGVWYQGVQAEDVAEIFDQHLLHDRPVARLRFDMPPGNHKQTEHYPAPVHGAKRVERTLDQMRKDARQTIRDSLQNQVTTPAQTSLTAPDSSTAASSATSSSALDSAGDQAANVS